MALSPRALRSRERGNHVFRSRACQALASMRDRLDMAWCSGRSFRHATGMREISPSSVPGWWPGRRAVIKLALGLGLTLPLADLACAQGADPRRARPQTDDR